MILIKNGHIKDPANNIDAFGDIEICDGKISAVRTGSTDIYEDKYERIIDAKDCIVAPGLVDVHVHFRDPGFTYKEDIHTGAAAAAAGGFTTVICMANTKPLVDNAETLKYIIDEGKKTDINVLASAAISKNFAGAELTDMDGLRSLGAAGFTDDGIPLKDGAFVRRAMIEAKRLDAVLSFHEEDPEYIMDNGINHGVVSDELGIYGSPTVAETVMIARDCMLALDTKATINIQHISSGTGVELVRLAKKLGADVWAEATPHHFTLNETAVLEHGTMAKMNPPLRTEEDRLAIIKGLSDGTIDMIATDHAPHSREEKEKPLTKAPSGIIGLETSLALGITELVKNKYISMDELIKKMSVNPAKLYKLNKGTLLEGADADIVIFNPDEKWEVKSFRSKSCNSPFTGRTLSGKVKYTICSGNVVYSDK